MLFFTSLVIPKISFVTTNWYQSLDIYFARWLLQSMK